MVIIRGRDDLRLREDKTDNNLICGCRSTVRDVLADTLVTSMSMDVQFTLATKETLDQGRAFETYCLLGGDVKRTAVVMRTAPDIIASLAHDFQWAQSIRGDIGDASKLEAFRSVHRMSVFMLGEDIHEIVQDIVGRMRSDPAFLGSMTMKWDKNSEVMRFDASQLKALAQAAGLAAELKYRALGDKEASQGPDKSDAVATALTLYDKLSDRFASRGVDMTLATAKAVHPL